MMAIVLNFSSLLLRVYDSIIVIHDQVRVVFNLAVGADDAMMKRTASNALL